MGKVVCYVLCPTAADLKAAKPRFTDPIFKPIVIPQTHWLEAIMYISELEKREHEWNDAEFVGCVAHTAWIKQPNLGMVNDTIARGRQTKSDIIALMGGGRCRMVDNGSKYHGPAFRLAWEKAWAMMGYDKMQSNKVVDSFFCNYWLAKPNVMRFYCQHMRYFAARCGWMQVRNSVFWRNASYANTRQTRENMTKLFGQPFFPMMPFIVERIAPQWAAIHGMRVTFLAMFPIRRVAVTK